MYEELKTWTNTKSGKRKSAACIEGRENGEWVGSGRVGSRWEVAAVGVDEVASRTGGNTDCCGTKKQPSSASK